MILTAGVAHPRKLIRHAIIADLKVGVALVSQRVYGTRVDTLRKTRLPAISVYCTEEPVDIDTSSQTAPRVLYRELEVEIGAWVPGPADPDGDIGDPMDDVCEQIEAVLDADRYLGGRENGLVRDTILKSSRFGLRGGEADPIVGVVTLTYLVTYNTSPAQTAIDDFLRAYTTTQMPGVESANAAVDHINVRTPP